MRDINPFFKYKTGWKIKPKLSGDPVFADYVKRMSDAQKALDPERYNKPKSIKPDGITNEDWIFSMQEKSTKEILTKQKDPSYKRDWSAPLPDNVLANPNASSKEELIGERDLTIQEISHVESIRRRPKNSLGQSEKSAFDQEKRDHAIDHFRSSPNLKTLSKEDMARLTELKFAPPEAIIETIPQYEWKKLTTWQAIKHWFKGGKVRRE